LCTHFRHFADREQNFTRLIYVGPYAVNINNMQIIFVFIFVRLIYFSGEFLERQRVCSFSLKALQARNAALVLTKNKPVETESPRR